MQTVIKSSVYQQIVKCGGKMNNKHFCFLDKKINKIK